MNRVEIVGLFTALDKLCDEGKLELVQEVIKAVLKESVTPSKDDEK